MERNRFYLLIVGLSIATLTHLAVGEEAGSSAVQTPNSIKSEAKAMSDRFAQILEEECPIHICNAVGCEATRFQTLDENQDSSLPGMSVGEPQAKNIQYRLAAVQCEFTYEPKFDEAKLSTLRQRLLQRTKQGGITIQLISRKLTPKEEMIVPKNRALDPTQATSPSEALFLTFAPFLPWIVLILILSIAVVTTVWIIKRPRRSPVIPGLSPTQSSDDVPQIPAAMLMDRTAALRQAYREQGKLADHAIRPLLENGDLDELCRILKHFGPELLTPFKERGQFSARLDELAEKYQDYEGQESSVDLWQFLERSERRLTAAKVRIATDPLKDEFGFMDTMHVDELIGLLRELSESEGIAIVVNGPTRLRSELFAKAGPGFVTKFVEYLGGHERLSDQFVRQSVQKARQIFEEKGAELRVVPLNRLPLFEEALNSLGSNERQQLIGEMQRNQPAVLNAMAPRLFLDASLTKMPDELLTEAFLQITPKAAAAYIASLSGDMDILTRLRPKLQEAIRKYIGQEVLDVNLVKDARAAISQFIKEKDAAGVIDLARINSSLLQ